MKTAKTLTASAVAGAKPKDKPYKLSDTDRLYVLVSTTGKKYWKWNYRLDGGDHTYTIGTFPGVGLAEARDRRMAAQKLVARGIHPADYDKEEQRKAKSEKEATLWSVSQEWIATQPAEWTPYYRQQVERFMGRYVRDTPIGQRPIKQITTAEIYELIAGIARRTERTGTERKAAGAPSVARLVRQWCSSVFSLAILSGKAERNPVRDLKASAVIARPKVKNNRALQPSELRALLAAMRKFGGLRSTAIAIRLLLLTFVRTGELRAATWDEFDFEKFVWTIPASRMKVKNTGDHVVPLAQEAIQVLEELRAITPPSLDGANWLFPNSRRSDACMSATTINRALERMGFSGAGSIGFSAHGFRGTASTLLHEMGFAPHVIEAQLAHKERNTVKAAYNKAQYLSERTAMMQKWADYIRMLEVAPLVSVDD